MNGRLRDVVLFAWGCSLGLLCCTWRIPWLWLALLSMVLTFWTGFGVCWVALWLDRRGK